MSDIPSRHVAPEQSAPRVVRRAEHAVEIVCDSGEGAQKCGQTFASVAARMGKGVWTVEIIPAEIQPPPRTPGAASGVRVRLGTGPVTNWGDAAHLVVAFNEQSLLARHRLGALADDALILIDDHWSRHDDEAIRRAWDEAMEELGSKSYRFLPVPLHEGCLEILDNPRKGKNMFALGLLGTIYGIDLDKLRGQIAHTFRAKSEEVYTTNVRLMEAGAAWAEEHIDFRVDIPHAPPEQTMVVMNGNQAVGMGAMAAGMELCSMYPITPATSVSHYLGEVYEDMGGIVHQAEDEIAAVGVAIGASHVGKVAFTVTSGPGLALKTESIGLAVMTETPLVIVDVQRGGPSTGLPTKVEQSDLLSTIFGQPGDTPKVVFAPATIEDCFHCMVTARRIAETFRGPVIVLTDANLATGVQPFPRPELEERWLAAPLDQRPVTEGSLPYAWNDQSGLSTRIVPGQPGGMYTATGLTHDEKSEVNYTPAVNQRGCSMRSRKLAVLQHALQPPTPYGDLSGDLLVVGWGSTKGAIEEAVDRLRARGRSVSSLHLTFLSPLEPGLAEILARYRRVMTVEINYSDEPGDPYITEENRRRGQLCWLLRAQLLLDIDCWTRVLGEPLRPGAIEQAIEERLPEDGTP
jgi:2-oxoglutarate ferredoxin oxidoreductase subunit alpha